jgi:hypothetical protein
VLLFGFFIGKNVYLRRSQCIAAEYSVDAPPLTVFAAILDFSTQLHTVHRPANFVFENLKNKYYTVLEILKNYNK